MVGQGVRHGPLFSLSKTGGIGVGPYAPNQHTPRGWFSVAGAEPYWPLRVAQLQKTAPLVRLACLALGHMGVFIGGQTCICGCHALITEIYKTA